MTAKSFDDVNGNGITRDASLDSGDTFDSRAKNTNYGGTGGANITTVFYQGTGSAGRKIGTTGGMGYTVGNYTSRDQTSVTYRNIISKCWITNVSALGPLGMDFGVGSGTAAGIGNDQHWWTVADDGTIPAPGFEIPSAGGWVFKLIDTQLKAFRRGTSGTPSEIAMVNFMVWVDLINTGGTDRNLIVDSPDYVETGFHAVNGDSTDPDITFDDFVDEDEGSGSTNFARCGLWRTLEGIIYWYGTNIIGRTYGGTVTISEFADSFKTLVCPGGYVREGANELEFDIGDAGTIITLDNITIVGRGRSGLKRIFDSDDETTTNGDVDTTLDEINYVNHGFFTGEQILYNREGNTGYVTGAALNGESQLVTGTTGEYYYAINVSADVFAVAISFANALAGTRQALTAQADEQHSFTRTPDTRYDFTVTDDATPGTFAMTNSNLTSARHITLADGSSVNDTSLITCGKLFLNDGTMDGNTITNPTTWFGDSFVECTGPQLPNIDNCAFIARTDDRGSGHAIEVTSATDISYAFVGNTFAGYASYNGTDFPFDGSSGSIVDTTGNDITITSHPYVDGEGVYYEDNGGTAIGGLIDGDFYWIGNIDANTIALYHTKTDSEGDTNRISLTGVGTGTTHRLDSANAAIWNNSGSDFTLSISGNGDSPSVRNTGAVEVIVESAVTIRVEGVTEGAAVKVVASETAGTITVGDTIFELLADSAGAAEISTFNYEAGFGAGLAVIVRTRQQGLPNGALQDDNGSYTDFTIAANSTTTDDMTMYPATPVVNQDSFQFGHAEEFGSLKLELSTVGAGGFGVTWEYWNGAWVALSGVTDGTSALTATGENIVSWTIPGDWVAVNDGGFGSYKYVRVRYTSGTMSTVPLGRKTKLDVTRYLPFTQNRIIENTGLTVVATWVEDTIATF